MKQAQNFQIVQNMKAYNKFLFNSLYFLSDVHNLQKRNDCPITSYDSISSDHILLPDLKSIILNESDLIRGNQEGLGVTETYSRTLTTNSSSQRFIFEEQFLNVHSISSDLVSDEF